MRKWPRRTPFFVAWRGFAFDQASLLTANSADLRDSVVPFGADLDKFDMIIYGTDPNALKPDATGVAALRAKLADSGRRHDRVVRRAYGAQKGL